MYAEEIEKKETAYRQVEKQYRERGDVKKKKKKKLVSDDIDLSSVLNFTSSSTPYKDEIIKVSFDEVKLPEHIDLSKFYMRVPHPKEWVAFGLKSYPGFYVLKKIIPPQQQAYWIKQCFVQYPQPPNITNLNITYGTLRDIWKNAQEDKPCHSDTVKDLPPAKKLLEKLAWSTLGYQYEWTSRKYFKDRFVPFAKDIGEFIEYIANVVGYGPYKPEAAIVNYYSKKVKSMGGHLDNAEYIFTKPIVSISLGNSAIFLLGGETKDITPIPILLESGDIMIMGGRARQCYHGVARILHGTFPDYLKPENVEDEYKPFCEFAQKYRLNINARQVFPTEEDEVNEKL